MRIVYVASDQVVPGRTGGSVHVLEVARGLLSRGHEVIAVVNRGDGRPSREDLSGVDLRRISWSPPHRFFRFRAGGEVARILSETKPDVVMERYYNFGGEGVVPAHRSGIPSLLEVNAPAVDHPGSVKALLDALVLVRPMARRRKALFEMASAAVAPLRGIVPPFAEAKTTVVTWGANVSAFRPARPSDGVRERLGIPSGQTVFLFSGSFRPWHGVHVFEEAARRLVHRQDLYFLLAGGGQPQEGRGYRGRRLGSLDYSEMPQVVAACDVGVAPYDTSALPSLRLGFFWSPLKIFEYMACGLPTLTIDVPPLTEIIREGAEGRHFREKDPADLARLMEAMADDPASRRAMGESARQRVVERYSWDRHCEQLEGVLKEIAA